MTLLSENVQLENLVLFWKLFSNYLLNIKELNFFLWNVELMTNS